MRRRITYLSKDANPLLKAYLTERDCEICEVATSGIVSPGISNHPDVFMCRLGAADDAEVFFSPEYRIKAECSAGADPKAAGSPHPALGPVYPSDCLYNAACTGRFFIHKLSVTAPELLNAARAAGMTLIDVPQGYAKCSICVVDEAAVITYDRGIAKACGAHPHLSVLLISPGHVVLPGFDTGFIGGTSGRIGDTIVFNGDLSGHPDFDRIREFIESRGLSLRYFPEYPLTDIGSII